MKISDLIKEDVIRLREQNPDPFASQGTPGQGNWTLAAQDIGQMSPEQRQAAISQQISAAPRPMPAPAPPESVPDFALSAQQMQQMSPEQWQQFYPQPADPTVAARPAALAPPTVPTGHQAPGGTNVLAYPEQVPSMPTAQPPQAPQQYAANPEDPVDPTVAATNPLQRQESFSLPTMKELFLPTKK